jgi:hypothetical protein
MEIKTISDIIDEHCGHSDGFETRWSYSQVEQMLKFQAKQFIDYIADNVEITEYNDSYMPSKVTKLKLPKQQFEEFKKLIK